MMVTRSIDLIDQELSRTSQPRSASSKKPVLLYLKEGHTALVRPLTTLAESVVLSKHSKWSDDPQMRVNAICASEVEKPCMYCQQAEHDKKLRASTMFYLPVYVYGVQDAAGTPVTYKEKDEAGNDMERPVKGVRCLELSAFGTVAQILKWFREYMRDVDNPSMTDCDFKLSQSGVGQQKTFVVSSKVPKPMDPRLVAIIPSFDLVRQRILDALPPVSASRPAADDPAITSFVQGVKNGQMPVEEEDDLAF